MRAPHIRLCSSGGPDAAVFYPHHKIGCVPAGPIPDQVRVVSFVVVSSGVKVTTKGSKVVTGRPEVNTSGLFLVLNGGFWLKNGNWLFLAE
jgi:hypothetical protein